MYFVVLSKQAMKDKEFLRSAGLAKKAKILLDVLAVNPFQNPPLFEILSRALKGNFSRRLSSQHRLVYDVIENTENLLSPDGTPYEGIVRVKRMSTH